MDILSRPFRPIVDVRQTGATPLIQVDLNGLDALLRPIPTTKAKSAK
jgi:hypothetical protein